MLEDSWIWTVENVNLGVLSFGVALLALLVSFWSAWISKRNVKEMQEQTAWAAEQASAADHSNAIARDALRNTGLALIGDIESKLHAGSPQVVVVVSSSPESPVIVKYEDKYPYPHPRHDFDDQLAVVSPLDDWEYDLYYVIRGALFNSGGSAVLVSPRLASFIDGESFFSKGMVEVPALVDPAYGKYFLGPGMEAIFEWRAGGCVDDWFALRSGDVSNNFLKETFAIFPVKAGGDVFTVGLEVDAKPLVQEGRIVDPWRVVNDRSPVVDIGDLKVVEPRGLRDLRKMYP